MQGNVPRNAANPDGSDGFGSRGELVAEEGMTLGFRHLDVMLAIGNGGSGQSGFATGLAMLGIKNLCMESAQPTYCAGFLQALDNSCCIEAGWDTPAFGMSEDPVVKQLIDALTAARNADGCATEIYADALRLAIVARLLCLRSAARQSSLYGCDAGDGPTGRHIPPLQKWRLKRVVDYVDDHLADRITLSELAAAAGLSRMYFAAQFRAATDLRPHEYVARRRIKRAEELLRQSTMTLIEISLTVGFQNQAHFTTVFKRIVGETPYQWRSAHCASKGFGADGKQAPAPSR
ncbi:MAG: AraC family transcriptional regulator [Pararobbsia sp.]